jgi:hypothetical protein
MQSHFPGEIVQGWATPLRSTRAALKVGIRKLREPPAFAAVPGALDHLDPNARLILVDDVVTTGSCIRALREVLSTYGKRANEVVSLGQGELRKVSEKDIDRITAKLGDPAIRPAVTGVLGGQLKHAVNYIERVFDEKTRLEISSYFNAEFARLRQLGLAHEGPAAGTPLSLAGLEGPQRHARIGAVISSGVSREGVRIRSSAQRAQGRPSDAPTIITELIELRCRWGAATLNERPKIVKKTLALVDDSGGAAVTRLPLRVAAREFVQGEDALGVLTERAQVHAATQSLTRGLVSARGRGIEQ